MATWSQPNTREKANELAALIEKPLSKSQALESLYYVLGSDELYESIYSSEEVDDVRPLILCYLLGVVSKLHLSWSMWDEEAIVIIKKLVSRARCIDNLDNLHKQAS